MTRTFQAILGTLLLLSQASHARLRTTSNNEPKRKLDGLDELENIREDTSAHLNRNLQGSLEGDWIATTGTVNGQTLDLQECISLTFEGPFDGPVSGSTGCISYSAQFETFWEASPGSIAFSSFWTENSASCSNSISELELSFLQSLKKTVSYDLLDMGDRLKLMGPTSEWVFGRASDSLDCALASEDSTPPPTLEGTTSSPTPNPTQAATLPLTPNPTEATTPPPTPDPTEAATPPPTPDTTEASTASPTPEDTSSTNDSSCPTTQFDTIVIGAGMAGLTAAKTLKDAGKTYIVLEMRNDVGGRMRTNRDFGVAVNGFPRAVEMGANWLLGSDGKGLENPVTELANEFGVRYYDMEAMDEYVAYEEGSTVPLDETDAEDIQKELDGARQCIDEMGCEIWGEYYNMGQTFAPTDESVRQALTDCGWPTPASGTVEDALEAFFFDNEYLFRPDRTSTFNFPESSFYDFGNENNFIADPMGTQYIAEQYASTRGLLGNIQFGANVTNIDYSGDASTGVTITAELGSGTVCEYQASTAIFTPSVAVLKKFEEQGAFTPELQPSTDVNPLELGTWVKVFFQFDSTFWDNTTQWLIMGTEHRNECSTWLNYDYDGDLGTLYPGSHVICCVMNQKTLDEVLADEEVETLSESIATSRLLNPLRTTYGFAGDPTAVYFTDWVNDPSAYGSWENWKLGGSPVEYYNFFAPRNNKLFISGSATCLRYWGLMHGAYYAGIRAAEWAMGAMAGDYTMPYSYCDDPECLRRLEIDQTSPFDQVESRK